MGYRRVFDNDTAIGYGIEVDEDKFCLKLRPDSHVPGPGLRTGYGPHYHAAFLIDPDGHRIEAVINAPA